MKQVIIVASLVFLTSCTKKNVLNDYTCKCSYSEMSGDSVFVEKTVLKRPGINTAENDCRNREGIYYGTSFYGTCVLER